MNFRDEIITAAVLGTDKKLPNIEMAPTSINNLLQRVIDQDKEKAGLIALSALLYYRAGQIPDRVPISQTNIAPDDLKPQCSLKCVERFDLLIDNYPHLLPEWLVTIHSAGKLIPEECLALLLDTGMKKDEALHLPIIDVIGERGRWLAKQNPDWSYASGEDKLIWEEGSPAQRVAALKRIHNQNPTEARELLKSTWSKEPARNRLHFMDIFTIGFSIEDQGFLESLATDRSKEVRERSAYLLKCLPYASKLEDILKLPIDKVEIMLFMSMSEADREHFLIASLKSLNKRKNFFQVSSFFNDHNCMWSEELSSLILHTMQREIPHENNYWVHGLIMNVGRYLNLSMIDMATKLLSTIVSPYLLIDKEIEECLSTLQFRRTMIEEIYK